MAGGLDGFLNFAVPIAIILWFGLMIYRGVKEQADAFGRWIAQTFRNMSQGSEEGYRNVIVYE